MANCVNISSKEFINLQAKVDIPQGLLSALVSVYQDKHGTDKFPTAEDILGTSPKVANDAVTLSMMQNDIIENERRYNELKKDGYVNAMRSINSRTVGINSPFDLKAKRLQSILGAKVLLDGNLDTAGKLLASDHPVSLKYKKPVIVINPEKAFRDTIEHEFSHIVVELLEDQPIFEELSTFAKNSPEYGRVKLAYPELSELDAIKETAASLLGSNLADKLDNELESISRFGRLLQKIKEILSNIFGKGDVINRINNELLNNKLEMSPIDNFNNAIERHQKFVFESKSSNKQKDVVDFLNYMNESIILNPETHVYSDKEGTNYNVSVTSLIKRLKGGNNMGYRKGSYEVPFRADYLTSYDFDRGLGTSFKIPMAFDRALTMFFAGEIANTSEIETPVILNNKKEYWHDFYSQATIEQQDTMLKDMNNYLDSIINVAVDIEENNKKYAQSGTYIHSLTEQFLKDEIEDFPDNVVNKHILTKILSELKANAKRDGSVLLMETTIFSSTSNNPGQIDIIEITKDGKFRIHDVKTVTEYKYNQVDYVTINEYLPQQLAYSTILQQYGLEEVDTNPYNVILVDSDRSKYRENGDKKVTFNQAKHLKLDHSNYIVRGVMQGIGQQVKNNLMDRRQLKEFDLKSIADRAKDLATELERAVDNYSRLTGIKDIQQAKFKDNPSYNTHFASLVRKLEKLREKEEYNGSLDMINNFIDTFINTAASIESEGLISSSGYVPNNYLANLRNFEHIGQRLDGIQVFLNDLLVSGEELDLGIDHATLDTKLKNAISFYNTFKDAYKHKRINTVAYMLASDSMIFTYHYKEKFESEARELGIVKAEDIKDFVTRKVSNPDTKALIAQKEYEYWVDKLTNGMHDISVFDHLLADPGINKAKVVQVAKVILDRADQNVRRYVDNYMPSLIEKTDKLKVQGTTSEEQYGKFVFKNISNYLYGESEFRDGFDKEVIAHLDKYNNRMLIPKETSIIAQTNLAFKVHYDYYLDKIDLLKRDGKAKESDIEAVRTKMAELSEDRSTFFKKIESFKPEAIRKLFEKKIHPEYAKLNATEKETLDFFTNSLMEQEEFVRNDLPNQMRLVHYSPSGNSARLKDILGEGDYSVPTVSLPRMTRSYWETGLDPVQGLKDKFEKVKNLFRPTGDDADYNYLAEVKTDLNNKETNDIPIFFRRTLSDPSLQSYDIPTMIALNMESVQRYHAYRGVEADLFLINDSVRDTNVYKKDALVDKAISSVTTGSKVITDTNRISDSLEKMMKSRLYSLRYANVNSKSSYKTAKMLETLKSTTSDIFLILNYNSAITTSFQGTLYRMIEGLGGEYLSMADVKKGSTKAWGDYGDMMKDILYNNYPKSKSVLMLRRFGLEAEFKALSRKFIENNAFKKTLDKGQLYAFTAMGEYLVTSSLMYSVMNNIKAMNANKEYIDKNGNVTTKDKAMTLDEAYTVRNGKLEVNPHLVYTDRNLSDKYKTVKESDNTNESLRVGLFISGLYKNLYGQYDKKLKSNLEMTVLGESLVHLRKWAIRGTHNRFRGLSSTVGMTFSERRKEENIDKRFYSQDMDGFKEGYITTAASYFYNVYKEGKEAGSIMAFMDAFKNVKDEMTTHERANLKRALSEAIIVGIIAISATLLARLAYQGDDDENDEFLWFATYSLRRVQDEALYYFSMTSMRDIMQTPIVGMSVLDNVYDVLKQVGTFKYDYKTDEIDWMYNDVYTSGPHKDTNKAFRKATNLIPGKIKVERLLNLLGVTEYDEGNSFKSSAEAMINPRF